MKPFLFLTLSWVLVNCTGPSGDNSKEQWEYVETRVGFDESINAEFENSPPPSSGASSLSSSAPSAFSAADTGSFATTSTSEQSQVNHARSALAIILPGTFQFDFNNRDDALANKIDLEEVDLQERTVSIRVAYGQSLKAVVLLYDEENVSSGDFKTKTPFQIGATNEFTVLKGATPKVNLGINYDSGTLVGFNMVADRQTLLENSAQSGSKQTASIASTGNVNQATVNLRLNSVPIGDVVFDLALDTTSDATINISQITFTSDNWNTEQPITFSASDDNVINGTREITLTASPSSSDPRYAGLSAKEVRFYIQDDDSASMVFASTSDLTTDESGDSAEIEVLLGDRPNGALTFLIGTSNSSEGAPGVSTIDWSPNDNWPPSVIFYAMGADDNLADGDQSYEITVSVDPSSDDTSGYVDLPPISITLKNLDNDSADFNILKSGIAFDLSDRVEYWETDGFSEPDFSNPQSDQSSDVYSISLTSQPVGEVVLSINSSRSDRAYFSPNTLTFAPRDWNQSQDIRLLVRDDTSQNGDQTLDINFTTDADAPGGYASLSKQLSLTVKDEEGQQDILINIPSSCSTTQTQDSLGFISVLGDFSCDLSGRLSGSETFSLKLASKPSGNVNLGFEHEDESYSAISYFDTTPDSLTFNGSNWDQPREIQIFWPAGGTTVFKLTANLLWRVYVVGSTEDSSYLNFSPLHRTLQFNHQLSSVSAGANHTCGITNGGRAYCWGRNNFGQLGNNSTTDSSIPVEVSGLSNLQQISLGHSHSCAIDNQNKAYCWGLNSNGQLGNGNNADSSTPVEVSGGHAFDQITGGNGHTCGINTSGAAYCWGNNDRGQLGDGSNVSTRNSPVEVNGVLSFSQITAGNRFSCGITTSNEAYCWGGNTSGNLGDNTTEDRDTPVAVVDGNGNQHSFGQITAGDSHACAIDTNGDGHCWGFNDSGQLGNDSTTDSHIPVSVNGSNTFSQIVSGTLHTCAITTTSQKAFCWGYNFNDQLGNGGNADSDVPISVNGNHSFSQITGGSGHNCGITNSKEIHCWGEDHYGQLGGVDLNP